ncbi:MAG: acyltransferase family protein, partial [Acidimicrobiales bacterium]
MPTTVADGGPPSASLPGGTPSASLPGGTDAGTPSSGFRLGNRPPLTGIRALALFTVLAYHSNFKTFPGSWVALQVFFVLSGFLITAMLAGEGRRNGRVDLKQFYTRRAARLLPPLLLAIALLAIYAYFVHVADASARVWGDSSAAFFYYADYRQALGHAPFFGYFAQSWSLSVEEQFYVVWSVLMVAAVAWHRHRLAYGFAIAGIALSIADRLWLTLGPHHVDNAVFTRVYYAFDSRADALFLGCLLGLLAADGRFSGWQRWTVRTLG